MFTWAFMPKLQGIKKPNNSEKAMMDYSCKYHRGITNLTTTICLNQLAVQCAYCCVATLMV